MRPIHELATTTERSAKLLSRIYGFSSVRNFSTVIPEDGVVVDYGAGNSSLGLTVAKLRPDIQWINTDLRYGGGWVNIPKSRDIAKAPSNLHFLGDDILKTSIRPGIADLVVSNALLPHIALGGVEKAIPAIHNMAQTMKTTGRMMLGKSFTNKLNKPGTDTSVTVTATEYSENPENVAQVLIEAVKLDDFSTRHYIDITAQALRQVLIDAARLDAISRTDAAPIQHSH